MDTSLDYNLNRWNRMLLNGCWLLLLLTFILEFLYISISPLSFQEFGQRYLLYPTLLQFAVLIFAELGMLLLYDRTKDYLLIATSGLMAAIIVCVHIEINYLLLALFVPVMVAVVYFSTKKLLFAFAWTLVSLHVIYWAVPSIHDNISFAGLITISIMFAAYGVIAWGVLLRGRELTRYSNNIAKSNQELLVKTIIMDKLAKTDALTELYNHITFHEYLDKLIEHHDKSGMELQLALIDIDNFKSVNDTFGHRAGDVVLRHVADVIRAACGQNDFVARYGGEEFAVIFTDKPSERSLHLLERIRQEVFTDKHDVLGGRNVTVSTGFSAYRTNEGKEDFFKRTDEALYTAKNSGKNRIVNADL